MITYEVHDFHSLIYCFQSKGGWPKTKSSLENFKFRGGLRSLTKGSDDEVRPLSSPGLPVSNFELRDTFRT